MTFDANLPVPHGATIDKITLNYFDSAIAEDLLVTLFRMTQPGRSWSDGLAGHRVNEETLETGSVFLLDNIEEDEVLSLVTISEQKEYRRKFREANKQRYIERNRLLEERYQKEKSKDKK